MYFFFFLYYILTFKVFFFKRKIVFYYNRWVSGGGKLAPFLLVAFIYDNLEVENIHIFICIFTKVWYHSEDWFYKLKINKYKIKIELNGFNFVLNNIISFLKVPIGITSSPLSLYSSQYFVNNCVCMYMKSNSFIYFDIICVHYIWFK